MEQIAAEVQGRLLCGSQSLNNRIERTVIAAMSPDNLRMHLGRHTLVITGGDRVDNILTAAGGGTSGKAETGPLSGLILTGGLLPPAEVIETLKHAGIPVLLCGPDTYTVASQVKSLQFKLRPQDTDKIEAAKAVVRDSLHVPSLVAALAGKEA
jgi:phosphate acetyltransferase